MPIRATALTFVPSRLLLIALPRRFSLPMQEIWLLQPRFAQRKRTGRFIAHPRFRAAFDFLQLRQFASDEHAADIAYWRDEQQVQALPGDAGADTSPDEIAAEEAAPRKRRRRRRSTPKPE